MPIKTHCYVLLTLLICAACAPAVASGASTPLAPLVVPPAEDTPRPPTPAPLSTVTLAPIRITPTPVRLPSPTSMPETTLLFTGDINPARCVYQIANDAGDMTLPYQALASLLQGADLTIGSLDASISDYNPPSPCAEYHRNLLAPAESVLGLQFAGFDVITGATNHIKDCGLQRGCDHEALLDTQVNLRGAGIEPVGFGRDLAEAVAPVILTVHGTRYAFLAFTAINEGVWADEATPGAAPFQKDVVTAAVQNARQQADVVIVLPHWGREFTGAISWEQWRGARELVEAGATLVVGNNPHHVQGVETFPNGAVVAYALGNFVFDQEWSDGTLYTIQGVMLRARFRGAELLSVDLIPIQIYDNFQPRLAPPEAAQQILQDAAESLKTLPGR